MHNSFEIIAYSDTYENQILDVWEKSVSVTHSSLNPDDFKEIKNFNQKINFNDMDVYSHKTGNIVAGFIGIAERKWRCCFYCPNILEKDLAKTYRFCLFNFQDQ